MATSSEIWAAGAGSPTRIGDMARRAEDEGWDGLALVDSQNLAPDPYVISCINRSIDCSVRWTGW